MRLRKWRWFLSFVVAAFIIGILFGLLNIWEPEYAYIPPADKVLNGERNLPVARTNRPSGTFHPITSPSFFPENGGIPVTEDFLRLGRQMFYAETFGNEVFLTDILGIVDGPFTIPNLMQAIMELGGKGMTNLRVELAKEITIGGETYRKGDKIDTGIDVPKGAYAPLGMPVKFSEGRLKVGITCAACHAKD